MRIGIFAKSFAGTDPETVLEAVAAAGFSTAQYNMACSGLPSMPDAIADEVAAAVALAARRTGVEIGAVSGTYNMIHPDPAERALGHARLASIAAAAGPMGTRLVTLCTGTRNPDDMWRAHPDNDGPEAWRDLLRSMETAVEIAERHDIELGIEPELGNVVNSAEKARRLIEEIGSPRIKIVLDPANLFETATPHRQREIIAEAIDLLADRIVLAHAKDRTADGGFTAAGRGIIDYPHYLERLAAAGFDGPLFAHGLAPEAAPGVAAFLTEVIQKAGSNLTGVAGQSLPAPSIQVART